MEYGGTRSTENRMSTIKLRLMKYAAGLFYQDCVAIAARPPVKINQTIGGLLNNLARVRKKLQAEKIFNYHEPEMKQDYAHLTLFLVSFR